jgi:glycosyltransferase involved in cell wall biosynthesis
MAALSIGRPERPTLVITSHGTDMFAFNHASMRWIKRHALNKAITVTVVSEAMREAAVGLGVDPDKVNVASMGVDLRTRFTPDPRIERSRNEILFVGRLAQSKGLNVLLDAMPKILAAHPDAALTIAGFGPEEIELRAQAKKLNIAARVRFTGPLPQSALPDLYRRAAVFVAPYVRIASGEQEGFGLTIVEAIGCGCPVVATDMPGLRDIIGNNGSLIEPENVEALAVAILKVLDVPRTAALENAVLRERVKLESDWSTVADRYADLLHMAAIACENAGTARSQD